MKASLNDLDPRTRTGLKRYWRDNRLIIGSLLLIWAVVSLGLGVVFVEPLNKFSIGGFPVGFWIAQQGSIYVFILIIGLYCLLMEYGDRKFHLREKDRSIKERQD